jgi:hypothetical protein
VGKVLSNFQAIPASRAENGMVQKVVGRIGMVGSDWFAYAPGSGKPCVYFKTVVQEQRKREVYYEDADGTRRRRIEEYWETIATQEQNMDFYVVDGEKWIYVEATDRKQFKIQAANEGGSSWNGFYYNQVPAGIQALIDSGSSDGWSGWRGGGDWGTGRYQYSECAFEFNEMVAAFGTIQDDVDPYSGEQSTQLKPFPEDALDEKYFEEHKWSSHAKSSWNEFKKHPCVLLSDDQKQCSNPAPDGSKNRDFLQIPPVNQSPPPVNWANNAFQFQNNWQYQYRH